MTTKNNKGVPWVCYNPWNTDLDPVLNRCQGYLVELRDRYIIMIPEVYILHQFKEE